MATRKAPKPKPNGNGQARVAGATRPKTLAGRARFLKSSVRVLAGTQGRNGRPFSFEAAIAEYGSWAYAAVMLNATAVSSTPLRLYTKQSRGRKCIWRTRRVPKRRKAYLLGDASGGLGRVMPDRRVVRKFMDLGDDFEEVVDPHPVMDLISRVNPWFNGYDLLQLAVIYLELTGNAYWHVIPALTPIELWPMPSQWTWIEQGMNQLVESYVYGRGAHQVTRFRPDEVIQFRTASPSSEGLWYGMGKMEAAWSVITLNTSQHAMDLSMADNNARPDYVMVVKSGATENALDRFEKAVERKLRGKGKQGRMLSITGEVDLKPLNWPPKDLAGREEVVEEIAAIFGVPVSLLKANDPNLASARVGYAQWRETTVLPITKLIEQKLNERLLPMFGIGDDAALAFDNPVPADEAAITDKVTKLKTARIITQNEAREELGMEPVPGGDEFEEPMAAFGGFGEKPGGDKEPAQEEASEKKARIFVQPLDLRVAPLTCIEANMINLLRAGASMRYARMQARRICAGERTSSGSPAGGGSSGGSGGGGGGGGAGPGTGPGPGVAARHSAATKHILASDLWLKKLKNVPGDAASASDQASIRKVLAALIAQVRHRVEKGDGPEEIARFMQDVAWQNRLKEAVSPMLIESIEMGVKTGAALLPVTAAFDVHNPAVQAFVSNWQTRLTGTVLRNLTVPMVDLLGDGMAKGESVAQLSQRVRDWAALEDPERGLAYRAERIARTESARAYVEGELETWRQSGVVAGKEWLLAPDNCEFCGAVAAQYRDKAIGLDGLFYQKGTTLTAASGKTMLLDYADVNGPPLHPGCRCDLLPVLSEDS